MGALSPEIHPRSPRLSFSLLNLLLGSALLVAVISHVVASRELNQLKAQVRKLRNELGYLEIADPSKCYARNVPQLEDQSYLFRIYLPPGKRYELRNKLVSKTPFGLANSQGGGTIAESGELTVRCKLYRNEAGDIHISIQGPGMGAEKRIGGNSAFSVASKSIVAQTPPSDESKEYDPNAPIPLLTLKATSSDAPNVSDDFTLWLQPEGGATISSSSDSPEEVDPN